MLLSFPIFFQMSIDTSDDLMSIFFGNFDINRGVSLKQINVVKLPCCWDPDAAQRSTSSVHHVQHVTVTTWLKLPTLKIARFQVPNGDSGFLQFLGLFQVIMANPNITRLIDFGEGKEVEWHNGLTGFLGVQRTKQKRSLHDC